MGLPAELFSGRGPARWQKVSDAVAGFLRADGKLAPIYAMCDLARMISVLQYCVGVKQAVKQVVLRPKHCGLCVERNGFGICLNDRYYIAAFLSRILIKRHGQ